MRNWVRGIKTSCFCDLAAMMSVVGILGFGICGCERKSPQAEQAGGVPVAVPAVTAEASPEGTWRQMDAMGPDRWMAIEGAAELDWNEETGILRLGVGTDLNGARWTGPIPKVPYVVELEARRMFGSDFFCGLTFPVRSGSESVSLIVGGWGGSLVGISSIDGMDASENPTGTQREFEDERWYRIRVKVENERLQAWIDDQQVVDAQTEGQKLSMRLGPIEDCAPFGLATWLTCAELRGVKWRSAQ